MNKKLIIVSVILSLFILAEAIALGVCFWQLDRSKVYNLSDFEPYTQLNRVINYDSIEKINYIDGENSQPVITEITDREAIAKIHMLYESALIQKFENQRDLPVGNNDYLEVYYKYGEPLTLPTGIAVCEGNYYKLIGGTFSQVRNIVKEFVQ